MAKLADAVYIIQTPSEEQHSTTTTKATSSSIFEEFTFQREIESSTNLKTLEFVFYFVEGLIYDIDQVAALNLHSEDAVITLSV